MSKAGESILRGAREALAYARGEREGFVVHEGAGWVLAGLEKAG